MGEQENLVSVEKDGRILSGVGVEESDLKKTLERHAPGSAMAGDDAPTTTPTPPARPPKRLERRIDQIAYERGEAQRRADAAEERAKQLEAELAEAKKPRETPSPIPERSAPPPPSPQPPAQAQPAFPKFDVWFQQHPEKDLNDYLNERDTYNYQSQGYVRQTDLDAMIRRGIETDRETRTRYEREGQEIQRGRAVYGPDFDRVVSAPHLMRNDWPQYLIDAINSQDEPEHIKYALGQNPQLAEQIRTMNPVFAGYELAKLLRSVAVAPTAPTARTMASPPPAPMQPVAGSGKTTATSSADLAMRSTDYDYDKSGYRETRAKERGLHRRR